MIEVEGFAPVTARRCLLRIREPDLPGPRRHRHLFGHDRLRTCIFPQRAVRPERKHDDRDGHERIHEDVAERRYQRRSGQPFGQGLDDLKNPLTQAIAPGRTVDSLELSVVENLQKPGTGRRPIGRCHFEIRRALPQRQKFLAQARVQQRIRLGGRFSIDGIAEVFNIFNNYNYGIGTVESVPSQYLQPISAQTRTAQFGFRVQF